MVLVQLREQAAADGTKVLPFRSLAVSSAEASAVLRRPFASLLASVALIVGSAAALAALVPTIRPVVSRASEALEGHAMTNTVVVAAVVALNLFEAGVHVVNAVGLWFNHALPVPPWLLKLAQHAEHLEGRPRKMEYLALNALDAVAFAGAFVVVGDFDVFWALLFAPHLATMLLAAWHLDVFLKLYLLDVRRFLPVGATSTPARRVLWRSHLFARGAFVMTDAVARTFLCLVIVIR